MLGIVGVEIFRIKGDGYIHSLFRHSRKSELYSCRIVFLAKLHDSAGLAVVGITHSTFKLFYIVILRLVQSSDLDIIRAG